MRSECRAIYERALLLVIFNELEMDGDLTFLARKSCSERQGGRVAPARRKMASNKSTPAPNTLSLGASIRNRSVDKD